MTKAIAILLFLLSLIFFSAGIRFQDKKAAGYLTKIKLVGAAILLLIGALALFLKPRV